jgi:hypothetical protein
MSPAMANAQMTTSGLAHARVIDAFSAPMFGSTDDLTTYLTALDHMVQTIRGGGLRDAEALLLAQAVTLNAIFARCATRAAANLDGHHVEALERYLRLALKLQSQCRTTLETLAILKNPTTVFARQANIAQGPQQVNNVASLATDSCQAPSRARAEKSGRNELLTTPA